MKHRFKMEWTNNELGSLKKSQKKYNYSLEFAQSKDILFMLNSRD